MIQVALVLAVLAALLHVFIFYLESIVWTSPQASAVFGHDAASAEATRELAFNQGFYNLFLAVAVFAGVAIYLAGQEAVGATLVLTGTASMAAAALVLLLSSASHRAAAVKQGTLPTAAAILLVMGLAF
ncbi:DUF1304 family protein [Demetria terragena]|uniref:DUF1304 family protein n=1 Tax=Demetria terragena TaxID=63959 RepID=UPI000363EB82|nr:DUF1304 domain-containing protein [Demetria terragena]